MLKSIIKQKIEPATFVLDALHNIVFTNAKADLFLSKKSVKKNLLQLSKALIEETSSNAASKKVAGIKLNKRNLSLKLEFLNLKKNTDPYFLFKLEDETLVINNSEINRSLLNKLNKTEDELKIARKTNENYAKKYLKLETETTVYKAVLADISKKYKIITNKSPLGIGIYDFDKAHFIEVNRKWLSILKCTKQQALNCNFSDLFFDVQNDGTSASGLYKEIKKTIAKKGTFKGSIKLSVNNKLVKDVDVSISKINKIANYSTIILNDNNHLTEQLNQLKIENEILVADLEKQKQIELNTIFKTSKNAIIILDKSGSLEETNSVGKKIWSLIKLEPKNIFSSKKSINPIFTKIHNNIKQQFRKSLTGQTISDTITFQDSAKNIRGFEYHISPIFDKKNVVKILLEFTDVTNKISDQVKLTESEKKFKAIFYNSLNFIARLSPGGIVLEHNRYGHSNIAFAYIKNLIGKPIWTDKFLDQTKKGIGQLKSDIKRCAKGRIISNEIDYQFNSKKNTVKLKYTLKPIFNDNKKLIWILVEGRDTETKLFKSYIKLSYFFENSLVASVVIDKDLQLIQTNKAFLKITGYTAKEVNKIGYLNLLYRKDVEKAKKNIGTIHTKKFTEARFKRRFVSKLKQLKTAIFSFKPIYENGKFNGGYVTLSDITELETKKQQLNDNIKKYKSLFDNNVTGLAVGDKDGQLLKVNSALCDILGYREKELLQMNRKQLSYPGEKDNSYLLFKDLWQAKIKKFTTTKKLVKKDGRIIETIVNVSGVFNDDDEFLFNITSFSDISEIKKLEAQLANKVIELEKYIESNLELENFAFLASHDLRAPLVTVLSFTKILQSKIKDKISKNEYKYLAYIETGVNRLQKSINDLLDFSSVSNNQLNIESVNTKAWLNRILKDYEALIKNNNAEIISKKLPQTINIDESLFTRLLHNLISNSLKFVKKNNTPKIEIGCRSNRNFHQFYFKDNGIGIPQKMQDKVFGIFKRLHPTEVYEGTGIGLALCKKVVERHNGKIWIESSYGRGTTFYFSLPVK